MTKGNLPFLNICKIGFTYVGAVIGAGFASGQEIFQFFIRYGKVGVIGIIIAGGLFIVGGVVFLQLARKIGVKNYYEIFYKLLGNSKGFLVDLIYILFILGSISVMLAGSGTIIRETLGISYISGVLITLLVVVLTICTGVSGILIFNSVLIPFLTLVIIYTSVNNIGNGFDYFGFCAAETLFPWYLSAIMYVTFNVFMSFAILSVIGSQEKNKKTLYLGGILGGVLLGTILLLMGITMYSNFCEIQEVEMPMLRIAFLQSSSLHFIYTVGLWFAMITTAIAHMYAFVQRVKPLLKLSHYNSTMLSIIVVLPLTRFGFAGLVQFLYPLYGLVTLGILIMMWWGYKSMD